MRLLCAPTKYPYCCFQNSRVFHDGSTSSSGYTLNVNQTSVLMLAIKFNEVQRKEERLRRLKMLSSYAVDVE